MPDTDTLVIFRTEHLPDGCRLQACEGLDPCNEWRNPGWKVVGLFELLLGVVIAPAERCDPAFALIGTEFKRRQGQLANATKEVFFFGGLFLRLPR
jgi:hypothetical protein